MSWNLMISILFWSSWNRLIVRSHLAIWLLLLISYLTMLLRMDISACSSKVWMSICVHCIRREFNFEKFSYFLILVLFIVIIVIRFHFSKLVLKNLIDHLLLSWFLFKISKHLNITCPHLHLTILFYQYKLYLCFLLSCLWLYHTAIWRSFLTWMHHFSLYYLYILLVIRCVHLMFVNNLLQR